MDVRRQNITQAAAGKTGKRSSTITPAYKGPRRLAFKIRRRGFTFEGTPSLLISDRYGVWSVTHRRYIRKTNHHRFHDTQDEELRSLRHKLADFYWAVMPKEVKASIVLFYRHRRQQRLNRFTAAVVLVALGVVFQIDKAGVEYGL